MNDLDTHPRSLQLLLLNGHTAYHFLFVDYASAVYAVVVCLSVCLSVTLRYCIKTAKNRMRK